MRCQPQLYLEKSDPHFFVERSVKYVSDKRSRYEEPMDVQILMRYKYYYINTNVAFNSGVTLDFSGASMKCDNSYHYRQDFAFVENMLIGVMSELLSK
ncbi:hypothetical protein [Myroides pelagicus]|uniref:Uncharacterized protein n=1 Tax=Myroides pelagicus TaxID=270914 RepID=A0A7K1GMN7_9FLAO|nr:hypothetical protein [Myroides pelagicus]MEC4113097.1 hypothetical protein [Myroides pelagicus]MTH30000.1 hypothetical protein [Myroides pelagicus]